MDNELDRITISTYEGLQLVHRIGAMTYMEVHNNIGMTELFQKIFDIGLSSKRTLGKSLVKNTFFLISINSTFSKILYFVGALVDRRYSYFCFNFQ